VTVDYLKRDWYYLDPINRQHGPLNDSQLDQVLSRLDCQVWTAGMAGWAWASEHFAREDVQPLLLAKRTALDEHGQPRFLAARATRRSSGMADLFALMRQIVADGVVTPAELAGLGRWLMAHEHLLDFWPCDVLVWRLQRIFEDGIVSPEEYDDLAAILAEFAAGPPAEMPDDTALASTLPADDPPPTIRFADRVFVFTGKFLYGTRAICEREVIQRGGRPERSITKRAHYVVVGTVASRDWLHSDMGTKILKAMEYRDAKRLPLAIVTEECWSAALKS
jgi:hypothetical protein